MSHVAAVSTLRMYQEYFWGILSSLSRCFATWLDCGGFIRRFVAAFQLSLFLFFLFGFFLQFFTPLLERKIVSSHMATV